MIKLTHEQLEQARRNSAFEDITVWDWEEVIDGQMIEYSKLCMLLIDEGEQNDIVCDHTTECNLLPFNQNGLQSNEWFYQFETHLLKVFESQIIEHLNSEFDKYAQNYEQEQINTHQSGE